jgi:hypothetical protein
MTKRSSVSSVITRHERITLEVLRQFRREDCRNPRRVCCREHLENCPMHRCEPCVSASHDLPPSCKRDTRRTRDPHRGIC